MRVEFIDLLTPNE